MKMFLIVNHILGHSHFIAVCSTKDETAMVQTEVTARTANSSSDPWADRDCCSPDVHADGELYLHLSQHHRFLELWGWVCYSNRLRCRDGIRNGMLYKRCK